MIDVHYAEIVTSGFNLFSALKRDQLWFKFVTLFFYFFETILKDIFLQRHFRLHLMRPEFVFSAKAKQ